MKQMLIYEAVVPVARDRHRNHSFQTLSNCEFARNTNSVPLMAQEFGAAAMHYAIVFGQASDGVVPAAVLGVRDKENLFLTADGSWDADYIPAFVRRYPFIFGTDEKAQTFTLMVDESCPGFNNAGKGERLFDAKGEQTEFLKNVMAFLGDYQATSEATAAFTKKLVELDLLEMSEAHLPIPADPERRMNGFLMVSREKLRALPADKLAELNASGALELIYLHLFSMNNLVKVQQKMAAASPATA